MTTDAQIAEVVEEVATRVGLEPDLEWAVTLVLMVASNSSSRRVTKLTPIQTRLVRALYVAAPRCIGYALLTELIKSTGVEKIVQVVLSGVKKNRPDLHAHIRVHWGEGMSWVGPRLLELEV